MITITKITLFKKGIEILANNVCYEILRSNLEPFRKSIKLNNILKPDEIVFEFKTK